MLKQCVVVKYHPLFLQNSDLWHKSENMASLVPACPGNRCRCCGRTRKQPWESGRAVAGAELGSLAAARQAGGQPVP